MKLIIDIEPRYCRDMQSDVKGLYYEAINRITEAVRNGIPYDESPQGDLISRSYLQQTIPASIEDEYKYVHQIIDNAPTVNAIPNEEGYEMYGKGYLQGYERGKKERSQGEWILNQDGNPECPFCHHSFTYWGNFCGNCGASMKGGAE